MEFTTDCLRLMVSGSMEPHELEALLEIELETHHKEAHEPAHALQVLADSLPGFGIVAAVLGIVITMASIGGEVTEIGQHVAAALVGTFLGTLLWKDVRYLGAYISGLTLLSLGIVTVNFYVDVVPTPPPLQSAWLVIHVLVASLATGFFAIGAGLSIMQLIRSRAAASKAEGLRFVHTLPGASALESLAYRVNVVGFVFWTFTLIAGAIWAERAWGRYWGWDTKEVWTFIIWTLFAGYIHARATRGWRGDRSAWLAIIGFSAVIFNYTVVNLFFKGLHSYSGL